MRVAVIGAGFAGLSAASELHTSGCDVSVFEARDRVGGRVWSPQLDNGAVIEMGAEFILPGNTYVRQLAAELRLGLWDKGVRYGERAVFGARAPEKDALYALLAAARDKLAADPKLAAQPAERFLEDLDADDAARELVIARMEISCAAPAHAVPAAELTGIAYFGDDVSPSIAGGNQRLATALAERLDRPPNLSAPVERIAWSADRAIVGAGGSETEFDVCVVSAPATVIDWIRFEPSLPAEVRRALEALAYGHAAKLFIPLREPPPPSAVISVPERYWTWTATGEDDRVQPVVSAFSGSAPALERLGVEAGAEDWIASIERLRPDLKLDPAGAVLSTWTDDPWIGAAYSTAPAATDADALRRRWGPLAFAGEHTAGEYGALMEGALRSGRRAAADLLSG